MDYSWVNNLDSRNLYYCHFSKTPKTRGNQVIIAEDILRVESPRRVALNNRKVKSIEERLESINQRTAIDHWGMDCVVGKGKACALVMTERKSRKELIFKLKAKKQECVHMILNGLERKHKGRFKELFKSIMMDNGSEFLNFETLEGSSLRFGEKRVVCYYTQRLNIIR